MVKNCRTCTLKSPNQNTCQLLRIEIDPAKDFCSKHRYEVPTCGICKAAMLQGIVIPTEDEYMEVCGDCAQKLTTCNFCSNAQTCKFETDPSSLPKMIQQRHPSMPMMITIKNPERVKITCETGCPCYNESCSSCSRDFGSCQNIAYTSLKNFQKK